MGAKYPGPRLRISEIDTTTASEPMIKSDSYFLPVCVRQLRVRRRNTTNINRVQIA